MPILLLQLIYLSGQISDDDSRSLRIGVVGSWMTGHSATDAIFDSALLKLSESGAILIDVELEKPGDETGNDEYEVKRARNLSWAQKTLDKGFSQVDVLIGATYSPAWLSTLGKGDDYSDSSWITMAPAITGAPIGTVPMGICEGLPVGLGVVAPLHGELPLVTVLAQIERVLDLGVLVSTFKK